MGTLCIIIVVALGLIVLERIFPDQDLPEVKGWWGRVIVINLAQLTIIIAAGYTWDRWLGTFSVWHLRPNLSVPLAAFIAYIMITFVFYWWHRARHNVNLFWLLFHQIHHSPSRIETVTSFFKHPLEIFANSIIIGLISYTLLGLDLQAGAFVILYTALAELFYHMNIKTPHWVGYFLQRPEMHRIHHQRNKHYQNFSDLPIWDMMFGTYVNPRICSVPCGFKPDREAKFLTMLGFRNVNNPLQKNDP